MGALPIDLAVELRNELGLRRAVETGTYLGGGTRVLAGLFAEVTSVELSAELHRRARAELADLANVTLLQGDSREVLKPLTGAPIPTLWFLDGHWSGGPTAGSHDECPVLEEIASLASGCVEDCVLIDDARMFSAAPPPPHDPAEWPTLIEVFDALRRSHPSHHFTVLADLVIAVPSRARACVDRFGRGLYLNDTATVAKRRPLIGLRRRRD